MAHIKASTGIEEITGALSKKKTQGVHRLSVTRKKHVHDPLTGEVVGEGPNELYLQDLRDYSKHPLTEGEQKQRGHWGEACRAAQVILKDRSHPRFMELYHRWRAQLNEPNAYKQFPPFVRTVLVREGVKAEGGELV